MTPEKARPGMEGAANAPRPVRVLHVEDNPLDAKLCAMYLKRAGFAPQYDVVTRMEEFMDALHSTSYDVVLADYRLPNWSGVDALDTLHREGIDVPFILVTGTVGEEVAVECIKKGATDYILKDRLTRLPYAVTRALEEQSVRAERRSAQRSRDLLARIVESSDDAIVGISPDLKVMSWNRGAERTFGYTEEEIVGRPASVLWGTDEEDRCHVCEAIERGESLGRHEMKGVTKAGKAIDITVTISPIRIGDRLEGASAIIRDITEQKRLQKELFLSQKMEAIGRLAAGVAHDFNNLLTVVTGYSALAMEELHEGDPLHGKVEQINRAGERAASLTRQLLAFSKKQVLQPQVLDLNRIVADMDRMLGRLIGEDVKLVTILDPSLGAVKADPGQIEQVIMNLAVNARDAMPKGGKLTIETENVELHETISRPYLKIPPGSYIKVAVTDTGVGMDADTQARIFEPFFTTKGQAGTGLGLSTVYGIVEQSGGAILVYSEPGVGTSFKIYLPRVREEAAEPVHAAAGAQAQGSETILVVEDEEAVRELIRTLLRQRGYTVIEAASGQEALRECERHPGKIDLMITDVIMPGMSGTELAERAKSVQPSLKVLYMSGYTDTAIVHHGVLDANTAFLEKPFAPQALTAKVRETLEG